MKKLQDWDIRYRKFVQKNKNKPFVWGDWDCCRFVDGLVKEMTGEHLIPKSLDWTDEVTAKKTIKEYGKTMLGVVKKAAKDKGIKPIDKIYMTKGDIVVYKQKTKLVGICDGFGILSPTDDGINVASNDLAIKVWRIDG